MPFRASPSVGQSPQSSWLNFANNASVDWTALNERTQFSAARLAECCGLSLRQLERRWLHELGMSPKQWLTSQRMAAARELLLEGRRIQNVALELKFKQESHFCAMFKRYYGKRPSILAAKWIQEGTTSESDNNPPRAPVCRP